MELTGKCKEEFEKWFTSKENPQLKTIEHYTRTVNWFYQFPDSMKWGVYQDFFDIQCIHIEDSINLVIFHDSDGIYSAFIFFDGSADYTGEFKTRSEARAAAIKKSNEIYNERE